MGMAASELRDVMNRLLLGYPSMASDIDRCKAISEKLDRFSYEIARQAVDLYVDTSGDVFLELPKLMALVLSLSREKKGGTCQTEEEKRRQNEREKDRMTRELLATADEQIRVMGDDQVLEMWSKMPRSAGKAGEWELSYGVEQIRRNIRFRFFVASTRSGANQ